MGIPVPLQNEVCRTLPSNDKDLLLGDITLNIPRISELSKTSIIVKMAVILQERHNRCVHNEILVRLSQLLDAQRAFIVAATLLNTHLIIIAYRHLIIRLYTKDNIRDNSKA